VADFVGSPSMNLVAGELIDRQGRLEFRARGFAVALPDRFSGAARGPATFGIRPEHVSVQVKAGPADISLPLRLVEPLGKDTLLYFDDATERAFIAVSEGLSLAGLKPGARLALTLAGDQIFLFTPDGRRIRGRESEAPTRPAPVSQTI
jgi:multiple sugar transport system ATP-binding protein